MKELHGRGRTGSRGGLLAGGLALAALAAAPHASAQAAQGSACERLASLKLPQTTITSAAEVSAGSFTSAGDGGNGGAARAAALYKTLPAFCRVAGVIKPSPDSNIKFETWMPLAGWNERFQGVGNGGLAGSISYPAMAAALKDGYATGSTDTGHGPEGGMSTPLWAKGHPELIKDFGYRAVHEMTVKSKAVTQAFFSAKPRYSYWIGCSEGGRQAMGEVQRFPDDYDGVVAGAPVFGFTRTQARGIALQNILKADPAAFVSGSKWKLLGERVLAQCDSLDGVKDRVIGNPLACKFDPATVQCKSGDQADCLSASQVKYIRAYYEGPHNPRTGDRVMWGQAIGSEFQTGARTQFRETPPDRAEPPSAFYRYFVFENENWDASKFDFDKDIDFADKKVGGSMNNFDPDLRAFKAKGGKLIQYHGWADAQPTPHNTIDYFGRVQKTVGSDTSGFYRLFLVPGMGHCAGGEGTDHFDKVAAIRNWVEQGKPPESIEAEHWTDGKADRSRPLCPYPKVAKYKGAGSTDAAANFACVVP